MDIATPPEREIALCLSGGGYRAMVFHLGALKRLNELGLFKTLARVSSVSGGSIIAGLLGLKWSSLIFDAAHVATNFDELVANPILNLANRTVDVKAILAGLMLPGSTGDRIVGAYKEYLFGDSTLQELPSDNDGPRFVINATNVQSGLLWRFSGPYMGDYLVGRVFKPNITLAQAVAASSAFPPFLSPIVLELDPASFTFDEEALLQSGLFNRRVMLTDGGVYDNLGMETAWKRFKTVLVSDGGGKMLAESKPGRNWFTHIYRVNSIIDNQVRSLRKRELISAYRNPADAHNGVYWGIRTRIEGYGLSSALSCPTHRTAELANIPTRLKQLDSTLQRRLTNWGYAICDAGLRRYLPSKILTNCQPHYPYPGGV